MEEGLGVRFEGERGLSFFHSTLVQTLFYGVFSSWVLWARQIPQPTAKFNWHEAVWHLRAPVLAAHCFRRSRPPTACNSSIFVEVLDWTSAALDRVDREAFFTRFAEGEAVPYFYEPFLEAFDPALRKQLGVWYTPNEVVRYMVARVDKALKDDLGYRRWPRSRERLRAWTRAAARGPILAEVLKRIAANLEDPGRGRARGRAGQAGGDLSACSASRSCPPPSSSRICKSASPWTDSARRWPMRSARASFSPTRSPAGSRERTKPLPFPELEEERDRAERVKQETPVLVILGNPPYNAFAGVTIDEERELFEAYRNTREVRLHKSKGLIDLYVRFFRMAERRIAEKDGPGRRVLSSPTIPGSMGFPSQECASVISKPSTPMRVDCLNGDKYKTGKISPDGSPDPSIFSTPGDPVGIQVGTAIADAGAQTAITPPQAKSHFAICGGGPSVRNSWNHPKRSRTRCMRSVDPILPLGLPFAPMTVSKDWFDWPALPDLFPVLFPGAKTNRDSFLVDIDLDPLKARVAEYFNEDLRHEEIARRYPVIMKTARHFDAHSTRNALLARGGPNEDGFIRYAYRPFDNRWLYWEAETKLLNDKRADYKPHVFRGNLWLSASQHLRKGAKEPQASITQELASLHLIESTAIMFPAWLRDYGLEALRTTRTPPESIRSGGRLLEAGRRERGGFVPPCSRYVARPRSTGRPTRARSEWNGPAYPLPGWSNGGAKDAGEVIAQSATRGRELASLAGYGRRAFPA